MLLAAPPTAAPPGGGMPMFEPLLNALTKCLSIVLIGYISRRMRVFTKEQVEGISAFVARVALPALVLLNMATLDTSSLAESANLIVAILLAKLVLFGVVVAATFVTSLRQICEKFTYGLIILSVSTGLLELGLCV